MTKYRCTECDKTYATPEAAARCHWGIGGVEDSGEVENGDGPGDFDDEKEDQ